MQPNVCRRDNAILAAILVGTLTSAFAATPVSRQLVQDPDAPYRVFITEVGKSFVKDHPFAGHFTTTVTMPNGTHRTIELVPTIHDGGLVVKLDDTMDGTHVGPNGDSYMGPDGTTINGAPAVGELMVVMHDMDHPDSRWHFTPRPGSPPRLVWDDGEQVDPATTHFRVSIYQVEKIIAFGKPLTHEYSTSLAGADGLPRNITLTPESVGGKTMMRLDDGGHVTEMPLGDRIVTGNLVVSVADMRPMLAAFKKYCAQERMRCDD